MQRLKASAALLLTAFFAVAGSFHQHPLPKPAHDHTGFCSAVSVAISLESCALCKVAQTVVHPAAQAIASFAVDSASRLAVAALGVPPSAGSSLLCDSRAPPAL
jgi:hypothetical protein